MITDELKTLIATHIKDNLFDTAKIGLGGNSTSPTATDLDVPLSASTTLTITNSTLNVIEVKVSVAGSAIQGQVIREVGLFNGSDLVYRTNFEGVGPFSTTETLELFILLEVE
jgi:hypothetical protein|tara:strand:+ start:12198 stop:12536 length:339 start_codon:yes stop_codon:yes gene_type:complete